MEKVFYGLNVEFFVEEIKNRPTIWDMRCETYKDRIKRNEAWMEVARQLYSNFDVMELEKQTAVLSELSKKWKNLRQCYKRELDSQCSKSGSAKKKRVQYVYFDILSFLAPMFSTKATTSNITVEEEDEDEEEEETEVGDESHLQVESSEETNQSSLRSFTASAKKSCKRKHEPENPVADICQFLKKSLEDKIAAEKRQKEKDEMDDDRQFLMSLLNYTRAVQEIHKLNMRSEVLQVVTKYYNMSRGSQPEQQSTHVRADIALIGLSVMGQNLILNMNDHGFVVCVYNRTVEKVDKFLANEAKGTKVIGARSIEEMVFKLKKPRRIMLLIKAGEAVDAFIKLLVPLLEPGDIIIDGGNSKYTDSTHRCKTLKEKGLFFVGSGVSGGDAIARYGPSLMSGGAVEAWPYIKNIFQSISAKVDGEPCCDWVGDEGSGHFVKMVHNGIEYGDIQLICETYHLLKDVLGLDHNEMCQIFNDWNKGESDSILLEITRHILKFKTNSQPLVDSASQKGTGECTVISALEYGMPASLIGEAVFARCLASLKEDRVSASKYLKGPSGLQYQGNKKEFIEHIRKGLYASKIVSYTQGFMLLREAAKVFNWELNYGAIAFIWRGGCITRSTFLGKIKAAFDKNPELPNLLRDQFFCKAIDNCQESWRHVVSTAVTLGIPTPAFSTALAFYDGFRSKTLPADLIQAQIDYFGSRTYELLSGPDKFIHTN
ncbi:6-phosphogluconate dehydrogenase, decarboxylating [Trichonephila inaurata madagascariensis]|uniref:6-phosphogluconate dehydrogenase, decarboxylating n=1 Tax=Trichonephila inaurata madagascariensis TaxID=2747483 RepID=A0A8X7CLR1_9ARAC|nr:6-phosphogluconate dehydrogenase, decarboxylating [Trichonephila inaurata madagascariensis]